MIPSLRTKKAREAATRLPYVHIVAVMDRTAPVKTKRSPARAARRGDLTCDQLRVAPRERVLGTCVRSMVRSGAAEPD